MHALRAKFSIIIGMRDEVGRDREYEVTGRALGQGSAHVIGTSYFKLVMSFSFNSRAKLVGLVSI